MKCRKVDRLLEAYVGGELPAAAKCALEEHLAICPDCRRQAEIARRVQREIREPEPQAVPERAWDSLLAALAERGQSLQRQVRERRRYRARVTWQIAAGLMIVASLIEITGLADLSGGTVGFVRWALGPVARLAGALYDATVAGTAAADVLKPEHFQHVTALFVAIVAVLLTALAIDLLLSNRTRKKYFGAGARESATLHHICV
ncbi:MAG: anti-sigma factor family protein [Planctomycetota bacterium]|jgi:anti-sigma factor RsiW